MSTYRIRHPKKCGLCGKRILTRYSGELYCQSCSHFMLRMKPTKELKDFTGPWYLTFDHTNPRESDKVVITSALVNEMKNELTEDEFWYYIAQLANHFRKGTPVKKRKLKYWSRQYEPS